MPNYTLHYFNGNGRGEILRMMFAVAGVKYTDKRIELNEWDKVRNDMPCKRVPVLEMDGGMKMPETMSIARHLAREHNFYPKSPMDMFRCDYISDCFYEIMHDYMRYYHWKNGRFMPNNNGGMTRSGMKSSGEFSHAFGNGGQVMSSDMKSSGEFSHAPGNNGGAGFQKGNGGGNHFESGNGGFKTSDMKSNEEINSVNSLEKDYKDTIERVLPFMERTLCMRDGGSKFFMGEEMTLCDLMCYCCLENPYMENQSMFSKYPKLIALRNRVAEHPKIAAYLKSRRSTNW